MKYRVSIVLTLLLSLFIASCASSDDDYDDSPVRPGDMIPSILNDAVTDAHPGFTLYVDSPEHGQWNLAAGKADLETGLDLELEHRLRLGSTTKTFTATLCLLLHEDGLLAFDRTLDEFLSDITVPHDSLITLENLLNMTSGILDYANDGDAILNDILDDPERVFTPEELIDYAIEITNPDEMEPGTYWHYSNTNYILLGLIVEEVTGDTYANLLRTRILDPLGLSDITIDEEPEPFARGYLDLDGDGTLDNVATWNPTPFWSAGCLIGTAKDLGRFARKLFDGQILSDDSMQLMQSWVSIGEGYPFAYGYGCGNHTDMDLIGHNGGTPGYAAEMWYHMPTGTVITVIANSNRSDGDHTFNVVYEVGKELNFGDYPRSRSMHDWIVF